VGGIKKTQCPHCRTAFVGATQELPVQSNGAGIWEVERMICPACDGFILELTRKEIVHLPGGGATTAERERRMLWPKGTQRPPVPVEVPSDLAVDYAEACLSLADSPKAAAALARGCLQHLLRTAARVKPGNLANEIQEVLDSKQLPSYLAESIDAVRNIGNFAAHPTKSTTSGAIVAVEPGEAEWTLDVLESLFDFYFVGPAKAQAKKAALDAKLKDAGKPPVK